MPDDTTVPAAYVEEFFGVCKAEPDMGEFYDACRGEWIRQDSRWEQTEREQGEYDFSHWDPVVEELGEAGRGKQFLPIMDYTAPWASEADPEAPPRERTHSPPREDAIEHWQAYVEAFVTRYPEIDYFEVWNEPNLDHFLFGEEPNHEIYVDRILKPAAEVIHDHGNYVVAPSFTTEHPDRWSGDAGPEDVSWSVDANIRDIKQWLSYNEAWRSVDYLSVHYTKGDTEKRELPWADDMMSYYDYVYREWIEPGKLRGVWNTEESHTAVSAGDSGFVSLEPWERAPYAQWVPRYTIPLVHWGIEHDWEEPHQYKLFWFKMDYDRGALEPHNLVEETEKGYRLRDAGQAMRTTADLLTDAERVGTRSGVQTGFGLFSIEESGPSFDDQAVEFRTYGFTLDDDILLVAWLDLPGIKFAESQSEDSTIQARVRGVEADIEDIHTVDYRSGDRGPVRSHKWADDTTLRVRIPRTDDPVLYCRIELS